MLPTQAERTPLYEEAQVIFKEQAPWATIAHSVVYMPMRPEVEGYVVHPLGGHIFNRVGLSRVSPMTGGGPLRRRPRTRTFIRRRRPWPKLLPTD